MKRIFPAAQTVALLLLSAGTVLAVPNSPGTNDGIQAGWTKTVSQINGAEVINSATTVNPAGTWYWIVARDNVDLGAPGSLSSGSSDFDPSTNFDGQIVRSFSHIAVPAAPAPQATDIYSGGAFSVQGLHDNTTFDLYAQACASGNSNNASCSSWIKLRTTSITTLALPSNVFKNPNPGDATTNSVVINVDSAKVTAGDVDNALITIHDVATPANDSSQFTVPGPFTNPFTVDSSLYAFRPNTEYTFDGQLAYPFNTTTLETGKGPFWTTPNDPGSFGSDGVLAVTHVTATVRFHNSFSGATFGNPIGTKFDLQFTAISSPTVSVSNAIQSITGSPSEQLTILAAGLLDGSHYTAQVRAENSGAGWPNSNWVTIGAVDTIAWGLTLTIPPATVFNTSATAHIAVTDSTGLDHFYLKFGATLEPETSWPGGLSADYQQTGLTPDTSYAVQAKLCEQPASTEYCSNLLPTAPVTFATTPDVPAPTGFTAPTARTLHMNWTANGNPGGITYEVSYSTDPTFSLFVSTVTTAVLSNLTITNGAGTPVYPQTTYFARIRAWNVLRPTWPDSGFASFPGPSVTTPNEAPTVATPVCVVTGTQAACTAAATDVGVNGTDIHNLLTYTWNATPAATSFTPNNQVGNNATTVVFPVTGSYQVSITVIDGGGLFASSTATVVAGATPSQIAISTNGVSVIDVLTGNTSNFNAIVCDQFELGTCNASSMHIMANQPVNWSLSPTGSGNIFLPVTSSSFTVLTAHNPGTFTLAANTGSATPGFATITILTSGPQFDSLTFIFANPSVPKGGTATATAHDNAPTTLSHSWTASDPSVTFTPSTGSGSPLTTAVVFSKAGQFTLTDTITDGFGAMASSSTAVTVTQVLDHLTVCPATGNCPSTITLQTLQSEAFTVSGFDQFNNLISSIGNVVWTTNGGNLNASGASASFSSSDIGEPVVVTATVGSKSAFITVDLISFDVSGAYAYPVPYRANTGNGIITFTGLGSSSEIRIFTPSGRKVFSIDLSQNVYPWHITNSSGESLASGVYFYVIQSPSGKKDGKLIIIK